MRCFKAITGKQGLKVPCGQCMNCRINLARTWAGRIMMENAAYPDYAWFLTLTYDDENVPRTPDGVPTLHRSEFQTWIKKAYRHRGAFRYYAVGEYGDHTLRPHYHMAVFPQRGCEISRLADFWTKGFTSASPLNAQRARYLAEYTAKKLTKNTDPRLEPAQEPEFRVGSRRPPIGAALLPSLVRAYRSRAGQKIIAERGDVERTFRVSGEVYPISEYILRKLRTRLGLPLLHRDRLNHPGYYEWHQTQEAENNPSLALEQDNRRRGEKKIKINNQTQRV